MTARTRIGMEELLVLDTDGTGFGGVSISSGFFRCVLRNASAGIVG